MGPVLHLLPDLVELAAARRGMAEIAIATARENFILLYGGLLGSYSKA